jgi:hypothetical protein
VVLSPFDIICLVVIGIILSIYLFFYIMVWKVRDLPLSHKIFYGGFFISLSLLLFCSILLQLLPDYSLAFVIYVLISAQLLLSMLSDTGGKESARKMRVGRVVLYGVGLVIGVIILYIVVFIYAILFGFTSLNDFYADKATLFGLVGTVFFILSLWGIAREERYGTGGAMKGSMFTWANLIFLFLFLLTLIFGLLSILDLLLYDQYYFYIHPGYNYIAGVLYFPIGITLFILSVRKLRRDIRNRKQYY